MFNLDRETSDEEIVDKPSQAEGDDGDSELG